MYQSKGKSGSVRLGLLGVVISASILLTAGAASATTAVLADGFGWGITTADGTSVTSGAPADGDSTTGPARVLADGFGWGITTVTAGPADD